MSEPRRPPEDQHPPLDGLANQILEHWQEHRPKLVQQLQKEGRLLPAVQEASERTRQSGLVYLLDRGVQIEGGYHFTYFRMRETSVEDLNYFELIDNGVYARLTLRF